MEDYILSGSFQIGMGNSFAFDFQNVIDNTIFLTVNTGLLFQIQVG